MSFPTSFDRLDPELRQKSEKLFAILADMKPLVVAFSGGVDSALLSAVGFAALGENFLAVTVHSPVETTGDIEFALEFARQVGFAHRVLDFDDLKNPDFVSNPPDRCYHCKLARFKALQSIAHQFGANWIAEGSNADDAFDYRPGVRAVTELGIRSPLAQAGMTKQDIRSLAHAMGLPVWNRPSSPCLATRFPYGSQITRVGLSQVEQGERLLHEQGFTPVRVRHFGETARIEVRPEQIMDLFRVRERILSGFRELGFKYVTVDLAGYRSGSMNEVLKP